MAAVGFKVSSFLFLHVHRYTDTPVSVSEFLKKHETGCEFFTVVNFRFSVPGLQCKGVISQDIVSCISAATIEEGAKDTCIVSSLAISC